MTTTGRHSTPTARLARLGFVDPPRAERLLADPALLGPGGRGEDPDLDTDPDADLVNALAETADPDQALLGLVRLVDSARRAATGTMSGTAPVDLSGLLAALRTEGLTRRRLLTVLGASGALADHLARHPEHWRVLREPALEGPPPIGAPLGGVHAGRPDQLRAALLRAVGADPQDPEPTAAPARDQAYDALRVAYRERLLSLAARDLTAPDPLAVVPAVAAELADLAAAALEAALAIARAELPAGAEPCRIAVIGMGKCGGRELNYVSDVDVIYVAEPLDPGADTGTERAALATATHLATALARACSATTGEGTLWPVDAALRPEGKQGPLVRTVANHRGYYERWAETWEFQALLKARVVAGDRDLGERYLAAIRPMVWDAARREHFVEDVQAMRRRVEQHVPAREADRQLKLGAGGLRDVEFSVQLLQLVHGRADVRLRRANTWLALEGLATYGYVGRSDAADMDRAYRMLRALEHRIQLGRLLRTHVVPNEPADLRRLGRLFGFRGDAADELLKMWRRHAVEVRRLHEKLFYRPLLAAAARLSTDEVRLTPEAAAARLAALGYRDPEGALRHLGALTDGVSRRAAIQRQLLPVLLGWFADGADPDAGLLAFRRLSESLGTTHWYLKMLRDSGAAADRLAHVLASSSLVAELLLKGPEAVALLEGDEALVPRDLPTLRAAVRTAGARHEDQPPGYAMAARAVRRRELVRTAVADIVGLLDVDTVGHALSDAMLAAVDGALHAALRAVRHRRGDVPTRMLVVAMGRLGGRELNYASDADLIFVHDPLPGADEHEAQQAALAVVTELRRLLQAPGQEPGVEVDVDLRPEGRQGVLVRSLDSYARYYARWSSPWEAQALLRALPAAGDDDLARRFLDLVDPLRWPAGGLPDPVVREIRRIKARVEAERLPRGADPNRHVKLGRGGLADVEWTVQLLQLQHAHAVPALRTTSTLAALDAAVTAELLTPADGAVLGEAWRLASRVRNATVLWRGRASDTPPSNVRDLDGVARLSGYPPASAGRLDEDYQRATRRARAVVERVFYG